MEFALVAVMFLFLLIATWDVARYLFMVQSMQLLADQAVRASTLPAGSPGYLSPQGCSGVPGTLPFTPPPFLDPATLLCVVLSNSKTTGANVATVTVEAPFTALTPGLSALTAASTETDDVSLPRLNSRNNCIDWDK